MATPKANSRKEKKTRKKSCTGLRIGMEQYDSDLACTVCAQVSATIFMFSTFYSPGTAWSHKNIGFSPTGFMLYCFIGLDLKYM